MKNAALPGEIALDPAQSHHLRDVLRLKVGDQIEAFDDAGNVATGRIGRCDAQQVSIRAEHVSRVESGCRIIIASAVPKGERSDWMIEKLSELGISRFIPLQTARSVVHPKGASKLDRWKRIATESARQSRRAGVMQIDELTALEDVIKLGGDAAGDRKSQIKNRKFFLSTNDDAQPMTNSLVEESDVLLLIGPEGGWTDQERARFAESGLTALRLTGTILRVETAAVAAAAVVACLIEAGQQRGE